MPRRLEELGERVGGPRTLERELPDLGSEIDQVLLLPALQLERRRLGGMTLRLRELLTRDFRLRRRPFLHWPDRLAGLTVEGVNVALFRHLEEARDAASADGDVEQDRCGRSVVIPDV